MQAGVEDKGKEAKRERERERERRVKRGSKRKPTFPPQP